MSLTHSLKRQHGEGRSSDVVRLKSVTAHVMRGEKRAHRGMRPRDLHLHRPLLVILSDHDDDDGGDDEKEKKKKKKGSTAAATSSNKPSLPEQQEQQSAAARHAALKKIYDIPMPETETSEDFYKDQPRFPPPVSYIRFKKADKTMVTYDADEADEIFVENHQNFGDAKRNTNLTVERFETLIYTLEKHEAHRNSQGMKMTTPNDAHDLFRSRFTWMNNVGSQKLVQDVVHYWVNKRNRIKKPLLREFWPITSPNDNNPHMVFRPRNKERYKLRKHRKNDQDAYVKCKRLQIHFQMATELFKRVIKREKLKREALRYMKESFDQAVFDMKMATTKKKKTTTTTTTQRELTVKPRERGTLKLKFKLKLPPLPVVIKPLRAEKNSRTGSNRRNNRERKQLQMEAAALELELKKHQMAMLEAQRRSQEEDDQEEASKKSKKPPRITSAVVDLTQQRYAQGLRLLGDTNVELRRVSQLRVRLDKQRNALTVPHFLFPKYEENENDEIRLDAVERPPPFETLEVHGGSSSDDDDDENSHHTHSRRRRRQVGGLGLTVYGGPLRRRSRKRSRREGYVCRTRIGRGGRYVIDRVRVKRRRRTKRATMPDRCWTSMQAPDILEEVGAAQTHRALHAKHMFERVEPIYARPPHRVVLDTPETDLPQIVDPPPVVGGLASSTNEITLRIMTEEKTVVDDAGSTRVPLRRDERDYITRDGGASADATGLFLGDGSSSEHADANQRLREKLDKIYEMSDSEDEAVIVQKYGEPHPDDPHKRVKFTLRL